MSRELKELAKKDVYIVTKPIQYINVLNIESNHKKVLLFVDSFINAKVIFEKIKKRNFYWDELHFFENIDVTFNWLIENKKNFDTLYIDSDVNHRKEFSLLRNLNITVYEEGVGTYRKNQYKPRRKVLGSLFLLFLKIRGYKNRRGGNKYTQNIIVYFPDFYKNYLNENKKNVIGFRKPFIEHLKSCEEIDIFNQNINFSDLHNKNVLLYITDWEIDEKEMSIIKSTSCEMKIIKPHPHLKQVSNQDGFDMSIKGDMLAEILILRLIEVVSSLVIVSKYSTATIYFLNHPKIEIINVEMTSKHHNDMNSYLDAYKSLTTYIKNTSK